MRATHLQQTELLDLNAWGSQVYDMLKETPYLVGSALTTKDWRDVDVRLILDDPSFDNLGDMMDVERFNYVMSLWGQHATCLPVDFQVQRMSEANERYSERRHALGIK